MKTLEQINKQLDIATFDDTSMEDFDLLLNEYQQIFKQQPAEYIEASKKRMQEIRDALVADVNRYYKSGE